MAALPNTSEDKRRLVGRLSLTAAIMTVGLITYGAWVRASGSGLGCPDWPLCEGGVLPELEGDTAIEFGHRLYAGMTMLVVAVAAWFAYRGRRSDSVLAWIVMGAFGAILFQAALGGATVLTELDGQVRLAHLSVALLTLALLTAGAVRGLEITGSIYPGVRLSGLFLAVAAFVVLAGGSLVASDLGPACPGLPLCDERSATDAAWLHGTHRIAATLFLLGLVGVAVWMRKHHGTTLATVLNHGTATLIVIQIGVGVVAVAQILPMELRVLHLGIATFIWWGVVTQWLLALRGRTL
jgi:heme A synthase